MKKSAAFGNEKASMEQALRDDVAIDRINRQAKQSHTPVSFDRVHVRSGFVGRPDRAMGGTIDVEGTADSLEQVHSLVRAAPELLSCLQTIVSEVYSGRSPVMDDARMTRALEAIDSALGERE